MPSSKRSSFLNDRFSHIYVEQQAFDAPAAKRILSRLKDAKVVAIRNYKEVFNRKKQCFLTQKKSVNLILAIKRAPFLYPLSSQCQTFGEPFSYYTTPVINCLYDCGFCFLHGMYSSANIVVFVNIEDFFDAVKQAAMSPQVAATGLQLNISYDSDLLALESLTGICAEWIRFVRTVPNLLVELRTKSAAYAQIKNESPCDRFILAWSLSPDEVIRKYEARTPRLTARLKAVAQAAEDGRPIRLCFDPVIPIDNGIDIYRNLIQTVFATIPLDKIQHVAVGPFRAGDDHLQKMRKTDPRCDLFWEGRDLENKEVIDEVVHLVSLYVGKEKVALWRSQS